MKTSVDSPDELMKEVKLRALNAGADLLRKRPAAGPTLPGGLRKSRLSKDRKTGLPVIKCGKAAAREIIPKRAAEILLEQEIKWHEGVNVYLLQSRVK